ncbi:ADP-ribosyl cyclase/cyclic ADP-ribose hydrolase-like isoform X2 [Acanthaster planci]|nr:ADP-ribosyl cyclase/cyclic ADP-ribose hydrolase-like isoform X2 [Acanthaster planci]
MTSAKRLSLADATGKGVALAVTVLLAMTVKSGGRAEFTGPGTDRDLETMFKGRCAEYLTGRVNPHVNVTQLSTKNCTLLWELFYNAFVYRDPCNVTVESFSELIKQATVEIPVDRAVYWDDWDVYAVTRSYADEARRASTLEFMLVGFIMNGLVFCGQTEDPGINYEVCPGANECGFAVGAMDGFWGAASKYFGSNGRGNVKFIINSQPTGGAFQRENSYFAEFELANMNPSEITRMDIYLVTFISEEQGDTCESQSIQTLKAMIMQKDINYRCVDQPNDVLHILCADNPQADECALPNISSRAYPSNPSYLA